MNCYTGLQYALNMSKGVLHKISTCSCAGMYSTDPFDKVASFLFAVLRVIWASPCTSMNILPLSKLSTSYFCFSST